MVATIMNLLEVKEDRLDVNFARKPFVVLKIAFIEYSHSQKNFNQMIVQFGKSK